MGKWICSRSLKDYRLTSDAGLRALLCVDLPAPRRVSLTKVPPRLSVATWKLPVMYWPSSLMSAVWVLLVTASVPLWAHVALVAGRRGDSQLMPA